MTKDDLLALPAVISSFANPAATRIDNPAYRDIVKTLNV
jgi:hypothetical protein